MSVRNANPYANPYANGGYGQAAPAANPYQNMYSQQNNSSASSVNTYGSRERRGGGGGYGGLGDSPSRGPPPPRGVSPGRPRNRYDEGDDQYEEQQYQQQQQQVQQQQQYQQQYQQPYQQQYRRAEREPPPQRDPQREPPRGYDDAPVPAPRARERPGMRTGGGGAPQYASRRQERSMDEVLQYIESEWSFMGKDDCIPVQIALQLMDSSSLGLAAKEPDFQQTQLDLQKALKGIVNEHHQDFNSSIGTYHKIQNSLQSSQNRVRYLKNALADSKSGLLTTKPELKGLATSSQSFDDTLQLFGQIEALQALPEKLEGRISEKRFLTAVDVLQEALRSVRRSELDGIGGISDLRSYFSNQEVSLTDILVEELHDHLYLKSPYCQDRWKSNPNDEGIAEKPEFNASNGINPWDRPVYHYLSSLDTSTPMADDSSRNVEADTFFYIHMLLESINKLGQLETAVARIEQRLPVELFGVVEKTNSEVDKKYPTHVRGDMKKIKTKTPLPSDVYDGRGLVLSDFLWTLYSKFEAIAEGHRIMHEVVSGIVAREKLPKPETYTIGFKELWKLFQSEMRSLLHDYLATDGDMTLRTGAAAEGNNVFGRNQRDKSKRMFRLSEMDKKSASMKEEEEDLDEILKSSVPGLVSKSRLKAGQISSATRNGQESSAAGHKLLIEPSVFNMTLLLPPSLSFLQRLKDIVPTSSDIAMSTLTSFLDDFLINVFHPQLEETMNELCAQSMIDLEAFTEDPQWVKHSPRPVFKGTVSFFSLVRSFSKMIDSIPHDQIFTQLVINQLVAYYDRCFGWYKTLVTRLTQSATNQAALKAAAAFAESGDIHDVTIKLLEATDPKEKFELSEKQVAALIAATTSNPLRSYDIISDPKTVMSLSLLHNSMQWLVSSVMQLRYITPSSNDSRSSKRNSHSRRWTLISSLNHNAHQKHDSLNQPVYLPMTSESVITFDTTLQSFKELGNKTLLTLQIDIRCGIVFMLRKALGGPDPVNASRDSTPLPPLTSYHHFLPSPPQSASPTILELNTDLISFDTNISAYLGRRERHFIIYGLARLVDRAFISAASLIGVMNAYGGQRLGLDILVLQQNLRNLDVVSSPEPGSDVVHIGTENDTKEDSAVLYHAAKFFDLFLQGPQKVIEFAQQQKQEGSEKLFTYDELKVLVELCFSEGLRSDNREDAVKAKKGEGDIGLKLGEIMWDS